MNITFVPFSKTHFALMLKWLESPHVKTWWDKDISYTMDLIKEKYSSYVHGYKLDNGKKKPISAFIIHANNAPIGYIQIYNAYDFVRKIPLTNPPKSLAAIDFFIGNTDYIGKNLGVKILKNFDTMGYKNILVDPDIDNIAAIKTYEKAGFKKIKTHKENNIIWMLLQNNKKMHKDEFKIDKNLVYNLLKDQFKELSNLPIEPMNSSGTDNALFRLGNEYIVRLPRINSATKNIDKEYEWLPKLSPHLNIPISNPIFKGVPSKDYPWNWLILKWNEGINPEFEQGNEYELLAKDLADFLNELHDIKLTNGPVSRRGVPLIELDIETKRAIEKLENEIDIPSIKKLWQQLVNIPEWQQDPVWIHGDLLPGNILIQNNRLNAVIDFSDVGMGDPAIDLIIAWSLFNSSSRKIFRENLNNIDNDTWERGKGWALSIALIILPYYKDSNPYLTSVAKRIIANILSE